jgi:hypothetical protein
LSYHAIVNEGFEKGKQAKVYYQQTEFTAGTAIGLWTKPGGVRGGGGPLSHDRGPHNRLRDLTVKPAVPQHCPAKPVLVWSQPDRLRAVSRPRPQTTGWSR